MKITQDLIWEAIEELNLWYNHDLDDLAMKWLDGEEVDKNSDASEIVRDCIDYYLMYDADIWSIMQEYQMPQNANYNEAIERFENDLTKIVNYLINNITEDEGEE